MLDTLKGAVLEGSSGQVLEALLGTQLRHPHIIPTMAAAVVGRGRAHAALAAGGQQAEVAGGKTAAGATAAVAAGAAAGAREGPTIHISKADIVLPLLSGGAALSSAPDVAGFGTVASDGGVGGSGGGGSGGGGGDGGMRASQISDDDDGDTSHASEEDGQLWMVMELADRGCLQVHTRQRSAGAVHMYVVLLPWGLPCCCCGLTSSARRALCSQHAVAPPASALTLHPSCC